MAIATTTERNNLATKYGQDAAYAALFTTAPSGSTPGTEVTGTGYARQAVTWGTAASGQITATATFTLPNSVTVAGAGLYTASSGGAYLDGGALATFTAPSSGTVTYTLTLTYAQS